MFIIETSDKARREPKPEHLKISKSVPKKKAREPPLEKEPKKSKVLITGDDVLIEYVSRTITGLKKLASSEIRFDVEKVIELFIGYYVWHTPDLKEAKPQAKLWERLEARLQEMRERRKRLVKSVYKKEGRLGEFEKGYAKMASQKLGVLNNFNSIKLEEMLRNSQK